MSNNNTISVSELFTKHADKLCLNWIAGKRGGDRIIVTEEQLVHRYDLGADDMDNSGEHRLPPPAERTGKSLVGYLNLIHPHQIQILGDVELDYLDNLRDITRHDTVKQVISQEPACIIIAEDKTSPPFLTQRCNDSDVPLFTSSLSSTRLSDSLRYYLTNLLAEITVLHGVFMDVMGIGVLITGPSGIGKSEVALELIARGHSRLIADDAPKFSRIAPDIVSGSCPEILRDFLEVRGLGIINVRKLYGDNCIKNEKYLRLIIRLEPMEQKQLMTLDRLEGSYRTQKVLDVEIPEITLPVAPGRNLAVLLECAVRNHVLRMEGYNSSSEFIEKQQLLINQSRGG